MSKYFFLLLSFAVFFQWAHAMAGEKLIAGLIEKVKILPENIVLNGKLDTGADFTSIHAEDICEFERGGTKWVRFTVDNRNGQKITFERKVIDVYSAPQHRGPDQERPVVLLRICVGNVSAETEVNLADRTKLKYPLLLGRSFMANRLMVDPSRKYVVDLNCPKAQDK